MVGTVIQQAEGLGVTAVSTSISTALSSANSTTTSSVTSLSTAVGSGGGVVQGALYGLTLSNNATSTTINIGAGTCADSTGVASIVLTAFTKLQTSWAAGTGAGGLDTGSIAGRYGKDLFRGVHTAHRGKRIRRRSARHRYRRSSTNCRCRCLSPKRMRSSNTLLVAKS